MATRKALAAKLNGFVDKVGIGNIVTWLMLVTGFVAQYMVLSAKFDLHVKNSTAHTTLTEKVNTETRLALLEYTVRQAINDNKWMTVAEKRELTRKVVLDMKREGIID